jgi:hypothetical protein
MRVKHFFECIKPILGYKVNIIELDYSIEQIIKPISKDSKPFPGKLQIHAVEPNNFMPWYFLCFQNSAEP